MESDSTQISRPSSPVPAQLLTPREAFFTHTPAQSQTGGPSPNLSPSLTARPDPSCSSSPHDPVAPAVAASNAGVDYALMEALIPPSKDAHLTAT